ncbi:MAG: hypothetical protein PHX43_07125 [Alphaproteobacteria bacterium]|nr:hypothetical protein [Alphaproteobacteria bacterium]
MNTIQTDKNKRFTSPRLLCAGLAVVILVMASPALVARIILLPGNSVREDLLNNQKVLDADIAKLISSREKVMPWFENSEILNDLALAYLAKANNDGLVGVAAANNVNLALKFQKKALEDSPADTFGWARMSYLLMLTKAPSQEAAHALALSMDAGPYEPRLLLSRISAAMLLFDFLDEDAKARLPTLLRESWRLNRRRTEDAARKGHFTEALDAALREDAIP